MAIYDDLDRYTPQALLKTALANVSGQVDKREGSIIFDALSPLSVLSANLVTLLKTALTQTDIQGATGDWLDLVASQYFIYRRAAVASQRSIQVTPNNIPLSLGATMKTNDGLGLLWRITDVLTDGQYVVTCTTAGKDGGSDYGPLKLSPPVDGIKSIVFVETINEGMDAESDPELRVRIWQTQRSQGYGGNFDDYKQWCFIDFASDANGGLIDGMFFFPASRYNGGGSVKIWATAQGDSGAYMPAGSETLQRLKAFLDPVELSGEGAGVVPVGHSVDVAAPSADVFDLTVYVTLKGSATSITDEQRAGAESDLRAYFESVRGDCVTKYDDDFPATGYAMTLYLNRIESAVYGTRFANVTAVLRDGVQLDSRYDYTITSSSATVPALGTLTLVVDEG